MRHFFRGAAMSTVVLTGFPGFLASAFLPDLLSRLDPATSVTCLVQSHYRPLAERRQAEIGAKNPAGKTASDRRGGHHPERAGTCWPRVRSKRRPRGLPFRRALRPRPAPAVGDEDQCRRDGHVLDFIEGCPHFSRLHYISTCYVSGRHPGKFTENDLVLGQRFNNYYEETKYLAEVEVQKRMKRGLAATIYRPAIVVGDSQTGATQKYDGPYGRSAGSCAARGWP